MSSLKIHPLEIAAAAAVLGLLSPSMQAATTVTYEFAGGSLAPTLSDPEALLTSASNLTSTATLTLTSVVVSNRAPEAGDATSANGTIGTGTSVGDKVFRNFGIGTAAAPLRTDYLSLTITPATTVSLDTIRFDLRSPGTDVRGFSVWYDTIAGDFDTTSVSAGFGTDTSSGTSYVNFSLDLGSLEVSAPVEFRFYGISTASNEKRIDNIMLTVAAVPEPSAAVLLGLGSVALLGFRRRNPRRHGRMGSNPNPGITA